MDGFVGGMLFLLALLGVPILLVVGALMLADRLRTD